MSYTHFTGEQAAHRLTQIACTELLSAVNDNKLPRTQSLQPLKWTGETPSVVSAQGMIRQITGWTEYTASAAEVRDWWMQGNNLLMQHRWLRGIRLDGPNAYGRFETLRGQVEDFTGEPFLPPVIACPPTPQKPHQSVLFVAEVPTGYLPCKTAYGGALHMLGNGGHSLVAGTTHTGKPVMLMDDLEAWGPPRVSAAYWRDIWQMLSGERMSWADVDEATARHMAITHSDPLAHWLDRNGWITGANSAGLDMRCPFHPSAFVPASYLPAQTARHKPRIVCPYCRRGISLKGYLAKINQNIVY